jgi:hypothetical protein
VNRAQGDEPVSRPLLYAGLVVGWAGIVFGLQGLISHPAPGKPFDTLRTLVLLNIANDALIVPVLIGMALLLRRLLPRWTITGVQVGLLASGVVLLFAYPLLGDWGRTARAGYSRLPWDYAHNVAIVLAGIWFVAACIAAWSWRRTRNRGARREARVSPSSIGRGDALD